MLFPLVSSMRHSSHFLLAGCCGTLVVLVIPSMGSFYEQKPFKLFDLYKNFKNVYPMYFLWQFCSNYIIGHRSSTLPTPHNRGHTEYSFYFSFNFVPLITLSRMADWQRLRGHSGHTVTLWVTIWSPCAWHWPCIFLEEALTVCTLKDHCGILLATAEHRWIWLFEKTSL